MVASLKSLVIPIDAPPKVDTSWLANLTKSAGDAFDQASQNKSFNRLADQIGGAAPAQQQPGFLSRLTGGGQAQGAPQAAAIPAPGAQQQMAQTAPGGIQALIASNVPPEMQQYATNLIGKESSFNPSAVSPTGAKGLAQFTKGTGAKYGLISDQGDMRGDPVANIKALVALTNDNRNTLTQALGRPPTDGELALAHQQGAQGAINLLSGKGVSAQNLAVNGVDPNSSPQAAAQKIMGYYGGSAPTPAAQAIEQQAPSQGTALGRGNTIAPEGSLAPEEQARLDQMRGPAPASSPYPGSGATIGNPGLRGYQDPAVTTAYQQPNAQPETARPPVSDGNAPMPVAASGPAPQQVAQNGPQTLAGAVTPVPKGGVSTALIQSMLRDPNLRQAGLQLWQQNATGKTSDGWDFVKLDDGTLARANKQTGEVQSIGNFQSSKKNFVTVGKSLYNADTGEWVTPPAGAGGDKEFFGTTVPYYDAQGQLHYRQLAKDGRSKDLDFGPGATAAPPTRTIDTGTELVTVGPGGQEISRVPKQNLQENRDKALGTELGKQTGDAAASLPQVEGSANQILATIDSLDQDPYLGHMVGPIAGRTPSFSADAARVQAKMDQIGGQSFLQAYNSLRGGGSITEVEGKKATDAIGRLSTTQNVNDYRAALKDLKDVVQAGVERARQKAAGAGVTQPASAAGTQTKTGISWKVEE